MFSFFRKTAFVTTSTTGNVYNAARDSHVIHNLTQNFTINIVGPIRTSSVQALSDHISSLNLGDSPRINVESQYALANSGTSDPRPIVSSTPRYSPGEAASCIIVEIFALLHGTPSDDYDRLKPKLDLLHKTIILATLAIQAYEFAPLGRNLAKCINPEIDDCSDMLRALLARIQACQAGLSVTHIRSLWHQVWRMEIEDEGLTSLMARLANHQRVLGEAVMALSSIAWTELGNGLRAGRVSLREFHTALRHGPQSLHHIPVANVLVVDHLGRNIPIAMVFCSSWQDFDFVINGYCRQSAGNQFIERGDYEIVQPDGHTIDSSAFASTVEQGMVLEMSIIIRRATSASDVTECPRCYRVSHNPLGGWIEWKPSNVENLAGIAQKSDAIPSAGKVPPISTAASESSEKEDIHFFLRMHLITDLTPDPSPELQHAAVDTNSVLQDTAVDIRPVTFPGGAGVATEHHRMRITLYNWVHARFGCTRALTWEKYQHGPQNMGQWEAVAYIDNVERGRGRSGRWSDASEEAARQTLVALGYYQ